MVDITMPQLGETVVEGTVTRWHKQLGDAVVEDEPLFDVSTDKIDTEVVAPTSGTLSEILVREGDTVSVGTVLARIGNGSPVLTAPLPEAASAPAAAGTVESRRHLVSPAVRQIASTTGVDLSTVPGSGAGGRVTRRDLERALRAPVTSPLTAPVPAPAATPTSAAAPAPTTSTRRRVVTFSGLRRRTAEHMVRSRATSAHALVAVEVDYENVDRVRRAVRDGFAAREGVSLTYLPFVSRAVIRALKIYPELNASVGAGELIIHEDVHLGIAVDLDFQGLVVPVVHNADSLRLPALARAIAQRAEAARAKRLTPDDLAGGTFTLTNVGSYGTLLSMPIINQPQIAIVSTDGVKRRPVVVDLPDGSEAFAVHPVGNVAMSWDHRAVDGAYAAAFLHEVRQQLESTDWQAELA